MRTVAAIAPGAAAFAAAGAVEHISVVNGAGTATCGLCGEWTDTDGNAKFRLWARQHATAVHDALRPSVLGLDLSLTRTGIAVSSLDPSLGTFWPSLLTHVGEAGSKDAVYAERGRRLVRQARAIMGYVDAAAVAGADFRLAVIEGPIYFGKILPSYYDRAGLWWSIYTALQARSIPIAVVTPDHRAKFICGVKPPMGNTAAAKKLVLDESRERWTSSRTPDVDAAKLIVNHDQADALGLCEMGVLGAKWEVPWQARRRHVENVALVTWPEVTA